MSKELAVREDSDKITFSPDQVGLIKRTIAQDATNDELELFLHQCRKTGLDPLAKQIYFQKYQTQRGPQMSIITGIDGYRLVADRTGLYAGNDDAVFEGRITQTRYNDSKQVPAKASVTVWKVVGGTRVPFTASAYWEEYWPGDKMGHMWFRMPHVMLAKVAEALALRKAFPADLSGVYTREEMDQAGQPIVIKRDLADEQDPDVVEGEVEDAEPPVEPPAMETHEEWEDFFSNSEDGDLHVADVLAAGDKLSYGLDHTDRLMVIQEWADKVYGGHSKKLGSDTPLKSETAIAMLKALRDEDNKK